MNEQSVNYKYWLVRTSDMGQIADITTRLHNKNSQLMLNQAGTVKGWMHLEDEKCDLVEEHKTSILYYRNGEAQWSGEIFECNEDTESLHLEITAMGWFELLNRRMVHTGNEWKLMVVKRAFKESFPGILNPEIGNPSEKAINEAYEYLVEKEFYKQIATESAQQLFYADVPMAEIANDLIIRANIDVPTLITIGEIAPTNSINIAVSQFQNVGEQITKLTAIESGFDFEIDPLERKFNTYRNEIRGAVAGKGVDRGSGIRFTFPGNCRRIQRAANGLKTQNRTEATGLYAVGKSESIQSIDENGLFEGTVSAPEQVYIGYLIAYATIETFTLEKPFTIITFYPRPVNKEGGVPKPFEQYEIGDIVYCVVKKGPRLQIGLVSPQPIRVFGLGIEVDDNGIEHINSIQTTYSQ